MKQITIVLLLAVFAGYMVNDADAYWGGWGSWYRPYYYGYYGWPRYYYPYYNYYGSYYNNYYKRALEGPQALQCTYFEAKGQLSCAGVNASAVECDTIRVYDSSLAKPFTFFAIGAKSEGNASVNASKVVYNLYPEMLDDNKKWLNATYFDEALSKTYKFGLYGNRQLSFSGFRVKDLDCFKNLTVLFDNVIANETISVSMNASNTEDIKVIGGILIN